MGLKNIFKRKAEKDMAVEPPAMETPNMEAEAAEREAIESLTQSDDESLSPEPKKPSEISSQAKKTADKDDDKEIAGKSEEEEVSLTQILENFEMRLRRIEYHLRLM